MLKKEQIWHKFQRKARPPLFYLGLNSEAHGYAISDSYIHFSLDILKNWEYYPNKMSFNLAVFI